MKPESCRCEAYDFPHRLHGGKCYGHNLADCPALLVEVDPYGTGDTWYREVEHGCRPAQHPSRQAKARTSPGSLGRELDDYIDDWREMALSAATGGRSRP